MRSTRFLPPAELAVVRIAIDAAGCAGTLAALAARLVPADGLLAAEVLRRAELAGELDAVRQVLAGISLPHRGGADCPKARHTTATTLRLPPGGRADLVAVAARWGLGLGQTAAKLAREELARTATEKSTEP